MRAVGLSRTQGRTRGSGYPSRDGDICLRTHVPYNPVLLLTLVGELLLLSFTLTAFGLMLAARIKQFQSFMALTQMLVMPLFFLSGALYPLNACPPG